MRGIDDSYRGFSAFDDKLKPTMNARWTICGDHWRIGILSDSLIRLEWSAKGDFEDQATQTVINRNFTDPDQIHARVIKGDEQLVIDTPALRLEYDYSSFAKEGLSAMVKGVSNQFNTWHFGDDSLHNLRGTARTLDEADGSIELGDGVISRDGWAILDDSSSNLIVRADQIGGEKDPYGHWIIPRENKEIDIYLFAYGHRYREALADFYQLTGPVPLLPRWALGNWWSRFHPYTSAEYLGLMDRFRASRLPFTVAVIDMDWHLTDAVDPKYGSGWTGYTWNRQLIPDPESFLRSLHKRDLRVSLNVHPRDGIRAFEKPYADMARTLGVDANKGDPIMFDLTNIRFLKAYLKMHHQLESQGVDFWWLDWQQGGVTRVPGLDPLWMLNHFHYLDSARSGHWPLILSRYAGPGSHRYPIGFSGDTIVTWNSMKFQPYFTATASNIGFGWWSHDIGGHMKGCRDDELEARWYQLGTFSPINRLHSSASPFEGKEPWEYPQPYRGAMENALRLRQALIPYLYTMNWRAAYEGLPLVQPLYWEDSECEDAYAFPGEYWFGSQILVSPILQPVDTITRMGESLTWLPSGDWFDCMDGRHYQAGDPQGRRLSLWRTIERVPVLAKAGGIIPLGPVYEAPGGESVSSPDNYSVGSCKPRAETRNELSADCHPLSGNPEQMVLMVFPGADGCFTLIEDAGRFPFSSNLDKAEREAGAAKTAIRLNWSSGGVVTIDAVNGCVEALPSYRHWKVALRGWAPTDCKVRIDGSERKVTTTYDESTLTVWLDLGRVPVNSRVEILPDRAELASNPVMNDAGEVLKRAQISFEVKDQLADMVSRQGVDALAGLDTLQAGFSGGEQGMPSAVPRSVQSALTEILLRS